jgi:small-conductance mechanosensitive channel
MRADPVLAGTNATAVDRARSFLEQLTTLEGRLAVTVALLLLTLVVAVVLAPRILRVARSQLLGRLVGERMPEWLELAGEYVPTTAGGIVLRTVQVGVALVTVFALLVVWGLADVAREGLVLLGFSLPLLGKIAVTLVMFFLVSVGSDLLEDSIARFSKGADRVTEHQEEVLLRIGQLGLVSLVVAGTLTVWGVDLSGLLVGAGFLGIVVGLAARQTLGSLIAGLVLMFSRPFTIGDWVQIGDQEGIVTEITIFTTRLENFDGEFVVLPNDTVSDAAITNRSKKGHLRVRLDVGVDYGTDPDHAESVGLDAIERVDAVETAPPPQVVPKAFGDSAILLELRFWIDRPTPPRKWQATAAVLREVKEAFEAADIKIPYPQRELSGRAETGGFRVRGATPGTAEGLTDAVDDGVSAPEDGDRN